MCVYVRERERERERETQREREREREREGERGNKELSVRSCIVARMSIENVLNLASNLFHVWSSTDLPFQKVFCSRRKRMIGSVREREKQTEAGEQLGRETNKERERGRDRDCFVKEKEKYLACK